MLSFPARVQLGIRDFIFYVNWWGEWSVVNKSSFQLLSHLTCCEWKPLPRLIGWGEIKPPLPNRNYYSLLLFSFKNNSVGHTLRLLRDVADCHTVHKNITFGFHGTNHSLFEVIISTYVLNTLQVQVNELLKSDVLQMLPVPVFEWSKWCRTKTLTHPSVWHTFFASDYLFTLETNVLLPPPGLWRHFGAFLLFPQWLGDSLDCLHYRGCDWLTRFTAKLLMKSSIRLFFPRLTPIWNVGQPRLGITSHIGFGMGQINKKYWHISPKKKEF